MCATRNHGAAVDPPVVLITGFLGAGKTSLLNALVAWAGGSGRRVAVVLNEFGRHGVDARLLDPGAYSVWEVNAGSIFCACTQPQFVRAIEEALDPARGVHFVAIEATGLAQPADLSSFLGTPPLAGRLRIVANLCLVDAEAFHKIEATLPAASFQVAMASIVALNKIDRVEWARLDEVESLVRKHNRTAPLVRCLFGRIDFENLLRPLIDAPGADRRWSCARPPDQCPPSDVDSVTLQAEGSVDRRALEKFLATVPEPLRAKGVVRLEGDARDWVVEWVRGAWELRPLPESKAKGSFVVLFARELDVFDLRMRWANGVVGAASH